MNKLDLLSPQELISYSNIILYTNDCLVFFRSDKLVTRHLFFIHNVLNLFILCVFKFCFIFITHLHLQNVCVLLGLFLSHLLPMHLISAFLYEISHQCVLVMWCMISPYARNLFVVHYSVQSWYVKITLWKMIFLIQAFCRC